MVVDLKANEVVRKAGDVQYYDTNKEIKGKLILTNQRIYFKTLEDKMKEYNLEIMPDDIDELLYFKTGLFSQNGLTFLTREGQELKFSVKKRNSWSEIINKMV